jgi:hypothetical protein
VGSFPTEEQAAQVYLAALDPSRFPTSSDGFLLSDKPTPGKLKYKGVHASSSSTNPFLAQKASKHLGCYPTREKAALAYLKVHLKKHARELD